MKGYKGNQKVGVLFSGGPAPSANAVISSVALNFTDQKIPVIGFYHGFEYLENFSSEDRHSLIKDVHYINIKSDIASIRNRRGVFLKTSRANPGKYIEKKEDLRDKTKNAKLQNILDALESLGIGFLVPIGGDDTLKTANYLNIMGLPVIHIPKTIDNDYFGIAWTFGYWSAIQAAQESLLSIKADSMSTDSYFIVELMGRKAGWISYAAGIAGESIMMVSIEDISEKILDLKKLANNIVDLILKREQDGKYYGVICIAESLADILPEKYKSKECDKHGNVILGQAEVGRIIRDEVVTCYSERTRRKKKVIYKQIGYEIRNRKPISFDVVLGSMLGFGAYKLYQQKKFGCMVSVSDNFSIVSVPFSEVIDPQTLLTKLRDVPCGSDFFELKEALSYRMDLID
jgi:6-phosphofructokinase 1